MKQQKTWTLKEIIFEREMKYKSRPTLQLNGFELTTDGLEFVSKVLNNLYEVYHTDDENKSYNSHLLAFLKTNHSNKRPYLDVYVDKKTNFIGVGNSCSYCYPDKKELTYISNFYVNRIDDNNYIVHSGLHIHKDCLDLGDKNETTEKVDN